MVHWSTYNTRPSFRFGVAYSLCFRLQTN